MVYSKPFILALMKAFDRGEFCGSTCNILSKHFYDMMDELASAFYTLYLSQASRAVLVEKFGEKFM